LKPGFIQYEVSMPKFRHTVKQQQQHVADWQLSSLSRTQYSLQHHLNVKTFCNWVGKWAKTPTSPAGEPQFIPASRAPEEAPLSPPKIDRHTPAITLNLKRCSITCQPSQLTAIMAELNLC
jgi:hypothetical protein